MMSYSIEQEINYPKKNHYDDYNDETFGDSAIDASSSEFNWESETDMTLLGPDKFGRDHHLSSASSSSAAPPPPAVVGGDGANTSFSTMSSYGSTTSALIGGGGLFGSGIWQTKELTQHQQPSSPPPPPMSTIMTVDELEAMMRSGVNMNSLTSHPNVHEDDTMYANRQNIPNDQNAAFEEVSDDPLKQAFLNADMSTMYPPKSTKVPNSLKPQQRVPPLIGFNSIPPGFNMGIPPPLPLITKLRPVPIMATINGVLPHPHLQHPPPLHPPPPHHHPMMHHHMPPGIPPPDITNRLPPPIMYTANMPCRPGMRMPYPRPPMNHNHINESMQNQMPVKPKPDKMDHNAFTGLMYKHEKDFLLRVQNMQIATDNPFVDDYYYMMYSMKKLKKQCKEDNLDEIKLILPTNEVPFVNTYKPTQFENSLGKLSTVSVHNPRKQLDVHGAEDKKEPSNKKHLESTLLKKLLLHIENYYDDILEVEVIEMQLLGLGKEIEERETFEAKRDAKLLQMFRNLRCENSYIIKNSLDFNFNYIICIRKGLNFASRLLPFLKVEQASILFAAICQNIAKIISKDWHISVHRSLHLGVESHLSQLTTLKQLVSVLHILREATSKSKAKSLYKLCLNDRFGISLLLLLVNRAMKFDSAHKNDDWTCFMTEFGTELLTIEGSTRSLIEEITIEAASSELSDNADLSYVYFKSFLPVDVCDPLRDILSRLYSGGGDCKTRPLSV